MHVKGRVSLTCNLHSDPDCKLFAGNPEEVKRSTKLPTL